MVDITRVYRAKKEILTRIRETSDVYTDNDLLERMTRQAEATNAI